jgi:TetR/AcrR family transcriptional regulator
MIEDQRNTEDKIRAAAESVFLEDGFSGARMQQIADRAGINKALLHYYFRSKDKLFELIINHKMKEFMPQVSILANDDSVPFFDKLDQFVLFYLGMLRKNPSLPMLIISTMNRNPEFVRAIPRPIGKEVAALLQREMGKGNIRSVHPHQFMLTVIGMCIFPFLARPIFKSMSGVNDQEYDQLIAERHLHVMQYARAILQP